MDTILSRLFLLTLYVMFFCAAHSPMMSQPDEQKVWHLSSSSSIVIDGSSNVNHFTCRKLNYKGNDYLLESNTNGKKVLSGRISLRVAAFECDNSAMTRDFMHTLHADKHPTIRFDMHELVFTGSDNNRAIGNGIIRIAGESREIKLHWTIDDSKAGEIRLNASKDLKFTTFNLTPPRKMMGLIQVHDEIKVHFSLVLREG